ncbi:uncharacterized protein LOC129583421 [Paramacrobiotus metropolitanus]|uniref:uncharacterized protein LOC129583421 n=1 Tax=Paramacrobiotus metropolitanus TaxID=2943436 RepID=UPI002445818E|nr:uncharacterized protein LOC129583421 [Paramacrobiotus metropolitanus]
MNPLSFFTTILACCSCALAIPGPWDLMQDALDLKNTKITGYFRIEALILTMQNPRGTTRRWMPCDLVAGKCDPLIKVAIDYHTPNYDFGKDSVPYGRFLTIWDGSGENNVDINKIVSKDVCNHSTRKVNVRILAKDKDVIRDDTIDHWSCFIQTTPPPAESEQTAQWSEEKTCSGHNSAHKITWKYRWFYVPQDQCKEVDGSSGIIRRYIPLWGKK